MSVPSKCCFQGTFVELTLSAIELQTLFLLFDEGGVWSQVVETFSLIYDMFVSHCSNGSLTEIKQMVFFNPEVGEVNLSDDFI